MKKTGIQKAQRVPVGLALVRRVTSLAARLFDKPSQLYHTDSAISCNGSDEALLQFSMNGFDAAVVRFNKTLDVESVSAKGREMFGVSPDLLLGTGLFERIHISDRVGFMLAAAQAREEKRASHCSVRIRQPVSPERLDYRFDTFSVEFVVTYGEGGQLVAFIRDAQDMVSLRDELALMRHKTEEMHTAMSRMLASVSHELRTPLNAIIGFSDMLLYEKGKNELQTKHAEPVAMIQKAGEHLLSIVNTILDVSKLEAGAYEITKEAVDVKAVVASCCEMLKPLAQHKDINISVQFASGASSIQGDKQALLQIVMNLLSNAIKFTPVGGKIDIRAQRHHNTARISIHDTGIGIAAVDIERLGKPFMQLQNCYTKEYQGTGLGLSLVKGLLNLHEGDMDIESEPGKGTIVTISLPLGQSNQETDRHNQTDEGEAGEGHGIALRKAG